ncbi:MAG: RICIN domain-containing protein [Sphingobacterium sp.]
MISINLTKRLFYSLSICLLAVSACKKENLNSFDSAVSANKKATVVDLNNGSVPTNAYYQIDSLGQGTQIFWEYPAAATAKDRLALSFLPSDYLPTGFYAKPGDTLRINVQKTTGTTLPKLLIGTYKRLGKDSSPQEVQLQEGNNTIIATKRGSLWIRYGTANTPSSTSKLTFSGNIRKTPIYIKNRTIQSAFSATIAATDTVVQDLLFVGQNVFLVMPRSNNTFSNQNNNNIIQKIDQAWDAEERLSGLDGSSLIHQPYPIPHTMTIMEPAFAGALAGNYSTGYSYVSNFFETDGYVYWFQKHESGHMHQQKWDWHAEIMADFYAVAANINLGLPANKIGRDGAWATIWTRVAAYFDKPDAERDYSTIWGDGGVQGSRYLGSAMLIQLKYAFGDTFYHNLHKIVRQEKPTLANAAAKHQYFMRKACEISGYDLTVFFKKWGFNYPAIYTEIANLNLPKPVVDPSLFTDSERPILENGAIYQIVTALNNSSVIDVNSSAPSNGTLVSLWSKNTPASNNQKFIARKQTDGTFVFRSSADSTKVLDVQGGSASNGTQIIVYTYHGGSSQKWMPLNSGNGYISLKSSVGTNSYLDIYSSNTSNGTKVQIWTAGTGNNQKFKFVKL